MNWEKSGNAVWACIQKSRNLFVNWEKLGSIRSTQKIPILNLWMTWQKVCPTFAVENKTGM